MQAPKPNSTLVILTPGFPENEAESVMIPTKQVFIRELNRLYPSLNIIILSFRLPLSTASYNWYQNTVIPFGDTKKGKATTLIKWIRVWKRLNQLTSQHKIIGIISFWCGECALVGKYFGWYKNIKHYSWISGQDARESNRLVKLIRPRAEELVAMSDFLVGEFYRNHKIRPKHLIPNGIDPSCFGMASNKRTIDVLGAGSLSTQKHYDVFIDIIAELTRYLPAINSKICGEGEEEERLKLLIERKQLQKNVALLGTTGHRETLKLMQCAKVFIHTSSYEGFGAVCIEALHAGAHVISFCKPMEKEIEHWHFVKSKAEMVQKTLELLRSPDTDYTPVTPYLMKDSARSFINLFIAEKLTP